MNVIAIHRKIAKSTSQRQCPQNVRDAVQRIASRIADRQLHANMPNCKKDFSEDRH